jgi:hypothetical protein
MTERFFKLHYALKCLGVTVGKTYRDLRIDWRDCSLHLFVNDKESKSWYVLKRRGWKLLRRENRFGTFNGLTGRHSPPLYEFPGEGVPNRAWELRSEFRPYQIIDWYGRRLEAISFPSPEKNRVTLMVREPDDPTTLEEVVLETYIPDFGPIPGVLKA